MSANKFRRKWQDYANQNAKIAENNFYTVFHNIFENTEFNIRAKPNEFSHLYLNTVLSDEEKLAIFQPEIPIIKHGIFPDYAIDHLQTGKILYVEVKRQDGWVEGKKRSDGRGNAHERSCKFFTPGLLTSLRNKSGIIEPNLPFWTVFQGDITRDPCRVREITHWYADHKAHFSFGAMIILMLYFLILKDI